MRLAIGSTRNSLYSCGSTVPCVDLCTIVQTRLRAFAALLLPKTAARSTRRRQPSAIMLRYFSGLLGPREKLRTQTADRGRRAAQARALSLLAPSWPTLGLVSNPRCAHRGPGSKSFRSVEVADEDVRGTPGRETRTELLLAEADLDRAAAGSPRARTGRGSSSRQRDRVGPADGRRLHGSEPARPTGNRVNAPHRAVIAAHGCRDRHGCTGGPARRSHPRIRTRGLKRSRIGVFAPHAEPGSPTTPQGRRTSSSRRAGQRPKTQMRTVLYRNQKLPLLRPRSTPKR